MKYDVFISYSRKDSPEAFALINRLNRDIPEVKVWYDIDGIESAADFQSKIIKAINESTLVVFICSNSSMESEFCRKEIMYAKNKGKTVIPYLLPGMKLDDWLLFEFGNINCIHASKADEVSRMVNDLKKWIGNNDDSQNSSSNKKTFPFGDSQVELEYVTGKVFHITDPRIITDQNLGEGLINGHEYVDLGLPSKLKWATSNIGAYKPEEYGDYFSWGEIDSKSSFEERYRKSIGKDKGVAIGKGGIDDKGCLILDHDAARQQWGGAWRMPTSKEVEELIRNTTRQWVTQNGIKGCLLRSRINGNHIFLPAAGWFRGSKVEFESIGGYYWCSDMKFEKQNSRIGFSFSSVHFRIGFSDNWVYGRTIRAVSD